MEEPIVLKRAYVHIKELKQKLDIRALMTLIAFLTLNIIKTCIFSLMITNPKSNFGSIFYSFFMLLSIFLPIYLLIFNFKSRLMLIFLYFIQTLYLFANLSYYLYFSNYLHLSQSAVLLNEGLRAAGHFAIPKNPILLILLLDSPAFLFLVYSYKRINILRIQMKNIIKLIVVSCLTFILVIEGWNFIHNYSLVHMLKEYPSSEALVVERYGTLTNNAIDSWVNRNDQKLIDSIKYGGKINIKSTSVSRPNFIIIQVESLDSNILSKKHNGKEIMPFMASLSQKCVYYPYTLSYHKAGGTSDCEFSVFNSVEPLDNFPSMKINSYMYPNSFIKLLATNSYHTSAFHGNISSYFSRDRAYSKIGFKDFHDMNIMGLKDIGWGAPDMDVFKYTAKQLENQSYPFIYHVITMTSHGPFTNARNYYNNTSYDDIEDVVVRDYFNSMSYVDKSLEYFLTYLEHKLTDTYIIIMGDHTPGINNNIFKQASFHMSNNYFEFVPILIVTPDRQVRMEQNVSASFLDIAPTILINSGISFNYRSDGINLLSNNISGTIPYKGSKYDRTFLFHKVLSD